MFTIDDGTVYVIEEVIKDDTYKCIRIKVHSVGTDRKKVFDECARLNEALTS